MKKTRRPVQRRMTCPSPQEISRALHSPTVPASAHAASLDDLIQRCLHCFGQCVSTKSLYIIMTLTLTSNCLSRLIIFTLTLTV